MNARSSRPLRRIASAVTVLAVATAGLTAQVAPAAAEPIGADKSTTATAVSGIAVSAPAQAVLAGFARTASGIAASLTTAEQVAAGESPDAASAAEAARVADEPIEDLSQRTPTTQIFANPDGTWTSDSTVGPVRAQDEDGVWQDIDVALEPVAGGFAPASALGDLVVGGGGSRLMASMTVEGRDLTWSWPTVLPTPVVDGDTATYADVVPDGDLVVTALPSGFRHDLVLRSAPEQPLVLQTPVVTDGAVMLEEPTGELSIETKAGDELIQASVPVMYDASRTEEGNADNTAVIDTTVTKTSSGATVALRPDQAFLTAADTEYPVTIDPTYTWSEVAGQDTWVGNDNVDAIHPLSEELWVGTPTSGGDKFRSLIRFPVAPWVIDEAKIDAANVRIRNFDAKTCNGSGVRLSRIIENWNNGSATWRNQPKWTDTDAATSTVALGASGSCPAGPVAWNVRAIAEHWSWNTNVFDGFSMRAVNETVTSGYRRYFSEDHPNSDSPDYGPRLTVDYNRFPKVPTQVEVDGLDDGVITALEPEVSAIVEDPDGGTSGLHIEIRDAGNNLAWSGSSTSAEMVANGQRARKRIPAGVLVNNQNYTIRVWGFDGSVKSGRDAANGGFATTTGTADSTVGTDGVDAGDRKFFRYVTEELTDRITAKANVGNGNLFVSVKDGSVAGTAGMDMKIERFYNSSIRSVGRDDSRLGPGWSTGMGGSVRLEFPEGNNELVRFYAPTGYRVIFRQKGDGSYERREPADEGKLTRNASDSTLKIRMKDKQEWIFKDASASGKIAGQLMKLRDKNGNALTYSYNASSDPGMDGTLNKVTDTRGRTANFTYSGTGTSTRLQQIEIRKTDATPLVRYSYTYQGSNLQLATSRVSAYNSSELPNTEDGSTKNIDKVTSYSYDANRQLTELRDARENSTSLTGAGNGGTTTFTYSSAGNITALTRKTDDGNLPDSSTSLSYFGNVDDTKCNKYDATTKRTVVDGERTDVVDETVYCADKHSRVRKTIDAKDRVRTAKFDASSNVETFDDSGLSGDSNQTIVKYDGEDNPTSATTPMGGKTTAEYGDSQSPNMPTAMRDFDTGGDPSKPATWNYDYDDAGNLIEAKADVANGKMVRYRYCWDNKGQLQRTDPIDDAGNNSVALDDDANVGCGTANQGNDTLRTYDNLGQLTLIDPPGTRRTMSYTYDALSRVKTVTDGRGVVITYTYDVYDRVIRQRFDASNAAGVSGSSVTTVQWAYDEAGNMIALTDPTGGEQFTFDELNRRTQQVTGSTVTKTYAYDPANNLLRQSVAGDPAPTVYTYDKLNLVETVDDPRSTNNIVSFKYDRRDKRIRTTFPMTSGGDLVQRTKYDKDNRVQCMYSYRVGGPINNDDNMDAACPDATANGLITFREYNYTKTITVAGQSVPVQTKTRYGVKEKGGVNTKFEYDPISRLTSAVTEAGNGDRLRKFDYTYDRHSNTTKAEIAGRGSGSNNTPGLRVGTTHFGYAPNDELCWSGSAAPGGSTDCASAPLGSTTYAYDGAGALTADSNGLTLQYNGIGQTSTIDPAGLTTPSFNMSYTGSTQDRRQTKANDQFGYGFAGMTAEKTAAGDSWLVRTPDGDLVSQVTTSSSLLGGTSTSVRYYLTDAQKSVIATLAGGGEVRRYLYEPYGEQIRSWIDSTPTTNSNGAANPPDGSEGAPTAADGATDVNSMRFASGYYDRETGWLKFGARYYDAKLYRWTQVDPKAPEPQRALTQNLYIYSLCNPTNKQDPRGRDAEDYVGSCVDGAIEGVGLGIIFGGVTGGTSALAAAGIGCVQGLATEAMDEYLGYDSGTLTGYVLDSISIAAKLF